MSQLYPKNIKGERYKIFITKLNMNCTNPLINKI